MEDGLRLIRGGQGEDVKHEMTHAEILAHATQLSIAHRFAQLHFANSREPEAKEVISILTLEKEFFVEDLRPEDQQAVNDAVKEWEERRTGSRRQAGQAIAETLHGSVGEIIQDQREGKGE